MGEDHLGYLQPQTNPDKLVVPAFSQIPDITQLKGNKQGPTYFRVRTRETWIQSVASPGGFRAENPGLDVNKTRPLTEIGDAADRGGE